MCTQYQPQPIRIQTQNITTMSTPGTAHVGATQAHAQLELPFMTSPMTASSATATATATATSPSVFAATATSNTTPGPRSAIRPTGYDLGDDDSASGSAAVSPRARPRPKKK